MKEDLNENTYTNDAYKLYLSDPKHEYSLQNTKNLSSIDLISSHESLVTGQHQGSVSHLPALMMSGPTSYQPQLYSSTHSLQGQVNYSMPHHFLNYSSDSDQPILSRFPNSLASSHSRSNLQIYSQLQIPSTSNFGSMKKKKNGKKRAEKGAGDSPPSEDSPSLIDQSHEEVGASYVPDYITINNKPVKV